MIPIYIFYSMFGFQRTGDGFWAAADQMARGFVLGATAGRTTLNGEGLQHEDGHSPLLASTNPAVVAYDPAFAFEIAHIVKDGLRRMYGEEPEDIYYYLTVYNEPYVQPAEPADLDVDGAAPGHVPAGRRLWTSRRPQRGPSCSLPAWHCRGRCGRRSFCATTGACTRDVWSVTSWTELRRDGLAVRPAQPHAPRRGASRRLRQPAARGPAGPGRRGQRLHAGRPGPDPRRGSPADFTSLGTDGWGLSDTRAALRRHFRVDAESITVQALALLGQRGEIDSSTHLHALQKYELHDVTAADPGSGLGES